MTSRRYTLGLVWVLAVLLLGACASAPHEGSTKSASDVLLQKQFEQADQMRLKKPQGRLIFAGFAMHSQSKAFRSDVVSVEKTALAIDPDAIVFKLNNPVPGQDADWPYASAENIALVLRKASAMVRPEDKVVLLFSTHGAVDILSVNFNNKFLPHITPHWLNAALSDLRGAPTLLLLSACFSGSFVEPLRGPNRVILTAAAKDRNSFGCQFQSTNTYFVEALVNQPALLDYSVVQLMERAKLSIDARERSLKLSPPSLPQISIGSAAGAWANQPLRGWAGKQ